MNTARPSKNEAQALLHGLDNEVKSTLAEGINSSDECERIKGQLTKRALSRTYMREKYEEAKGISKNAAVFFLDRVLDELDEHEVYMEKLEHQNKEKKFPETLQTHLSHFDFNRQRIERLRDFFESEYYKFDLKLSKMPAPLTRKIEAMLATEVSYFNCSQSLLYSLVIFYDSSTFSLSSLSRIDLRAIARHNDSFLDFLIGQEALKRAKDDILYFELATDLLVSTNKSSDKNKIPESPEDIVYNKKRLANKICKFVINNDEPQVKCQLVKAKIEAKLEQSILSTTPWPLGWAGSRYKIVHDGKTYTVPQGIYKLYHLTQKPEDNFNQIKKMLSEKSEIISPMHSFFRAITGTSRSKETQKDYEDFTLILWQNYHLKN